MRRRTGVLKTQAIITGLVLLLLPGCATLASGQNSDRRRPVEVLAVKPSEGAVIRERQPRIEVDISYTRCACGPHMAARVEMELDGQQVVNESPRGTQDVPQSDAYVGYEPPTPLAVGTHEVRVRITSSRGRVATYTWSFRIRGN